MCVRKGLHVSPIADLNGSKNEARANCHSACDLQDQGPDAPPAKKFRRAPGTMMKMPMMGR